MGSAPFQVNVVVSDPVLDSIDFTTSDHASALKFAGQTSIGVKVKYKDEKAYATINIVVANVTQNQTTTVTLTKQSDNKTYLGSFNPANVGAAANDQLKAKVPNLAATALARFIAPTIVYVGQHRYFESGSLPSTSIDIDQYMLKRSSKRAHDLRPIGGSDRAGNRDRIRRALRLT
ncbi:MAG: hypothetical protein O3B01_29590 [Planctomycetota bacterium]|nr:hypothetical protein [Planctomycetota bacterium]MDA1142736.1 hypothetical protein [Planctomycetota bacterium]